MGIKEQHDLFDTLYKSKLSRLELLQMAAEMIDMVREQVNNGRINGCKILTEAGLEEIIAKTKEDKDLIPIRHPDAKESLKQSEESEEDTQVVRDEPLRVHVAKRSINFSANVNKEMHNIKLTEDASLEITLAPSHLLPQSESEWIVTIRNPSQINMDESKSDLVIQIDSKGARNLPSI